ncbi:MAG: HAD family acid phosphatase, partial [Ignavibacteriaceae bacterium]
MKTLLKIIFPLLLFLLLVSCTSEKPVNLTVARNEVKEYYESGKYDEELNEVIKNAREQFLEIEFRQNSVVIIDVDETALSNYGLAELMGFGYVYEMNKKWNAEMKSPAILQVKEFYEYLLAKGARIIFLTGRNIPEYEATYKNLKQEGYTVFDTLITQREHEYELSAQEFKSSKRKELIEEGYEIIGTVGDQW